MTMNEHAQELKQIAMAHLQPSPTNPRKAFVAAELGELKASIAASGVQVPLLVRRIEVKSDERPGFKFVHEIVAGERRYRAAKELGLKELPCLVRELTDAQARETQIVENLQRAGIHPLEEAEAFEELRGRLGSAAAVAQAVAKEQSYVAKCLRLLALTEHSKQSLLGGLITIEHALLLARLAEREQNDALKWTLDRNTGSKTPVEKVIEESQRRQNTKSVYRSYGWEPQSVKQLKARIENEGGIDLKRAPWKLDDGALLPAAGPCSTCEKNTKANAPLFGDLAIDEQRCVDGACFGEKTAAFVAIAQLKAGHSLDKRVLHVVPRLSWKTSSVKPALTEDQMRDAVLDRPAGAAKGTANPQRLLRAGQWVEAKKGSCPNVRPGVTADWSDAGQRGYGVSSAKLRKPGETLLVCIAAGCKVHRKEWEKAKGGAGAAAALNDEARERARQQEQDLVGKTESAISEKVLNAALGKLTVANVLELMADELWDAAQKRNDVRKKVPAAKGDLLNALTLFLDRFEDELIGDNSYFLVSQPNGVESSRKALWAIAKKAGVDADAIAAKHFVDAGGVPEGCERLLPKGAKAAKVKGEVKAAPKKSAPARKAVAKKKAKAAKR